MLFVHDESMIAHTVLPSIRGKDLGRYPGYAKALMGIFSQCPAPTSTLTPQAAAAAMTRTKAALIRRPEMSLLLQPWSTAMSQMKKKTMATTPRDLSHIGTSHSRAWHWT